jgi:hypothetical protein
VKTVKMAIALILVVALATVVNGDITGRVPRNGSCLCFNGNAVNVRSSACGARVIGSANSGQCYRYTGSNSRCSLNNRMYQFFRIDYNRNQGWTAGVYLNLESDSRCSNSRASPASSTSTGDYTCQVTDQGKRVHESGAHDCKDSNCQNTCRGGQCVAYVKCRCKRNGKYPPYTGAWRPGQKLTTADRKCNRNIAANTAIATFNSNRRYSQHAAVFIKCLDDYTIQAYDQWCGRSVDYTNYSSSNRFYDYFATIRSSSDGESSNRCRSETSGSTNCAACYSNCTRCN